MKAKLIKTIDGYELFTQGFLKGSTNHGLIESLNIEEGPIRYKLSLKNCQAIENGYDLDELAENLYFKSGPDGISDTLSFKKGFQKALEILGDKRFSEKDMSKAWSEGYHRKVDELNGNGLRYFDKFIQSLQQTEWDVEVVMVPAMSNNGNVYYGDIPKLDDDGCLILKKL